MTTRWSCSILAIMAALTWGLPAWAEPSHPDPTYLLVSKPPQRQRNEIRAMRAQTLRRLPQIAPGSRQEISRAAGYAIFKNQGATGEGLVHDNQTGRDTYMKMAGLAAEAEGGFRNQRLVLILAQRDILERFIQEGWTFGDQAGDAAQIPPDIKIYQITENGLAPQVSLQGSKFWPDETLNSKSRKTR
ncbi:MAG: hypothetical protein WCP34_04355 [Pseudomonadota bacterium]